MLPRLPHSALLRATPRRHTRAVHRTSVDRLTRQWLTAPGSLTARLRLHGQVSVRVMRQGHQSLWPQEQGAVRARTGHVREVVLTIDGRPAVWARSVTSAKGLKGPWRALKGLGTRPLAELLFEHRGVRRDPLWSDRFPDHSRQASHVRRQWRDFATRAHEPERTPAWARRSVFWHKGQALQVMECFSPWVLRLSPRHR